MVGANPSPTPIVNDPSPQPPKKVIVVTNNLPTPSPTPIAAPSPRNTPVFTPSIPTPMPTPAINPTNLSYRSMSFGQLKNKIAEARRQMQARPMQTAMTDSFLLTDFVRVAFFDWKTNQIDYAVLTKTSFLSTTSDKGTISSNGKNITLRTIRGNGVNTPIVIVDDEGKTHLPLLVQYPVEKGGRFIETAYYISTHPGVVTPEVVNAGKIYVRNTIDIAREKLREKGIFIQPQVADMAERLSALEHVDHQRFRTEYHPNVYNDIFALYALNEGNTYRYSVSSAGAGGMVQMIPSTYRMVRSQYYNVPLMPDFVEGMRNHVNAATAMLLYMQSTWNDLVASPTVYSAVETGIATPQQLMAAGYNSNPAKLAGYINRGGANWTALIPRETKIYLQILSSMDQFVPMSPRTR
ncbi:MAG TPA: hypothetical protein PKY59_26155 [Pyrinomonadaceae bacterium]|nr:hypothetical protein [Pyrinomonadaceae bacterium]